MVDALLAADTVPITRERKGREELDDLRPSVLALAVAEAEAGRRRRTRPVARSAWWPSSAPSPAGCAPSSWCED